MENNNLRKESKQPDKKEKKEKNFEPISMDFRSPQGIKRKIDLIENEIKTASLTERNNFDEYKNPYLNFWNKMKKEQIYEEDNNFGSFEQLKREKEKEILKKNNDFEKKENLIRCILLSLLKYIFLFF